MGRSRKKKILIVEDEKVLSEIYAGLFEAEGFDVSRARTGTGAARAAKREKPDFILLDILLPGRNGLYFLERKNASQELAAVPVVAFSNFDDPGAKKRALELGAKEYLIKTNYTPQEVVKKAKQYLRKR